MAMHIGYETVVPHPLHRIDIAMDRGEPVRRGPSRSLLVEAEAHLPSANRNADLAKAILKADKESERRWRRLTMCRFQGNFVGQIVSPGILLWNSIAPRDPTGRPFRMPPC